MTCYTFSVSFAKYDAVAVHKQLCIGQKLSRFFRMHFCIHLILCNQYFLEIKFRLFRLVKIVKCKDIN